MISEMTIQSPPQSTLDRLVRVNAALGEPGRVRLVAACLGSERCVCQLVGLVGLSTATVSRHLTVLRDAGLLASRKDGRWVHYRAAEPEPGTPEADGMAMVGRLAADDSTIAEDRARLGAICGLPAAEVARRLKAGEAVCPPDCC
ncbi:MAG: hypothetical protein DHS20C14_07350 [Phycisphaeraceae bacterium]|nr:MAG: hypothetical protein DHS20C14_07350 [Phycisphaeraceae bacterium]